MYPLLLCAVTVLQYFVVVTRLNLDWPNMIRGLQFVAVMATGVTEAITFSPTCIVPMTDAEGQALAKVVYGLVMPVCIIGACLALWALR